MGNDNGKRVAGEAAAQLIEDGMTVGLGTGTTAAYFVAALGARMRNEGLKVRGIATSHASEVLAQRENIPLVTLTPETRPDITVDGADELDPHLTLIKGGGGALVREKLVARASKRMVVIADDSKAVEQLGEFPVPVAVLPFGATVTLESLRRFALPGATPPHADLRRTTDGSVYVTDDGLNIVDMHFGRIDNVMPHYLQSVLRSCLGRPVELDWWSGR